MSKVIVFFFGLMLSMGFLTALTFSNGGTISTHIDKSGYEANADVTIQTIPEKIEPKGWWEWVLQLLRLEPKDYQDAYLISICYDKPSYTIDKKEVFVPTDLKTYYNTITSDATIQESKNITRELVKASLESTKPSEYEIGDSYCYYDKVTAQDLPVKYGDNSIYIYTNTNTNTILNNTRWEPNNVTHLEINNVSTNSPYDSLVGYWSFDADIPSTTYDLTNNNNVGNNITGTYSNHAFVNTTCDSGYGSCEQFDGVDDFVNFKNPPVLNPLTYPNGMTIMAWVKLNSNGTYSPVLIKAGGSGANDIFFTIGQNGANTNQLCFFIDIGWKCSSDRLSLDKWYLLTAVWNTTTVTAYINGVLNATSSGPIAFTNNSENWYIGQRPESTWDKPLNGSIDEVMIFGTPLNISQILDIYNNQSSRFKSSGTQIFNNSNIDDGYNNTANITITSQTLLGSKIGFSINNGSIVNFTDNKVTGYSLTGLGNMSIANLTFWFYAGTNNFYTPFAIGNLNITTYFIDPTERVPPVCTLISRTPTDINDTSTGQFQVIMNCSDASGINVTKVGDHYQGVFVTRTIEGLLTAGIPNRWSIRPPANNIAQVDTLLSTYGQIMRAQGRGESYWYEFLNTATKTGDNNLSSWLLYDNYSYAVNDGEYHNFTVVAEGTTNAIVTDTVPSVRVSAFRQNIPLSYESLVKAPKLNATINKNLQVLVYRNDLEAMKGSQNYTITVFRNVGTTATAPTAVLRAFYCNSTYNPLGGTTVIASPNCVSINAISVADLSVIMLTDRNSSYSTGTYSVTNGKIGGITATPYHYYYYDTLESNPLRGFNYRYATSATNTNVSFNQTNRTWTSTNDGATWTNLAGTLDLMEFTVKAGNDEFQFGYCVYDLVGNIGCNKTLFVDTITATNHPISSPTIVLYNSSRNGEDLNLNGTYEIGDLINIRIACAKDPDSVGNVTHNLTLRNEDGTYNSTINPSFLCPLDIPKWIDYTLPVAGKFRMNVTATAGDNVNDIQTYLTTNNFTIIADLLPPVLTLTLPTNITYSSTSITINGTCTDANTPLTYYSLDGGAYTSFNFNATISTSGYEVYHNLAVKCNDSYSNNVYAYRRFYVGSTYVAPNETDPIWTQNLTNLNEFECNLGYEMYGVYPNGTIKCRVTSTATASSTPCKYKKLLYYNPKLAWIKEGGCV